MFAQINAVDKRKLDIAETEDKIKLQQFEDAFEAQKKRLLAEGRRFTNEDVQDLVRFGRDELGLSMSDMSFMLQDYVTAQEADDEAQMRRLQPIIDQQGFVEMSDLEGASPELVAKLNQQRLIRDQGLEELSTDNKQEARDTIRAFTGARIKIEEGQPEPVEFVRQYNNAYRAYERYMRGYMLGGMTQDEAQTLAIKKLNENNAQGTYTRTDLRPIPASKFANDLSSAQGKLNDQTFDHTTTILPNSEPYLEQLDKWTKGEAAFPRYYTLTAATNKYISGWDLASQQYRIKYGRELGKDAKRRAFENQSAAVQAVLNFHPTQKKLERARTTNFAPQASTMSNPLLKRAADITSNYESAGSGGYNAVNQGGEEGGTKIPAGFYSGDFRNMTQHGGRDLTTLTVGEIMDLQADPGKSMSNAEWVKQGKLHAVGRYQFIGSTLKGLVKRLGVSRGEKFTPELQDRLFLSLLKSGGPSQWVGLKNATTEELALIRRAQGML